jgi:hypothetical protein
MAEERRDSTEADRKEPSTQGLGATVAQRAVKPIAAAAVTAGAAYLTRKSSELWRQKLAPKIRAQGGARAAAENTIKRASETIGDRASPTISALTERGSSAFAALTERVGEVRDRSGGAPVVGSEPKPKGRREAERRERERRRDERRRALRGSQTS